MNYIFNDYIFGYVRSALYIEMLVNEVHSKLWWKRTPNFLDVSKITQCNDNEIFLSPRIQAIGAFTKMTTLLSWMFSNVFFFKEKSFRNLILNSPKFHSSNPIANRSSLVLVKACMTSLNKPQFTDIYIYIYIYMSLSPNAFGCTTMLCYLRGNRENFCDSRFYFDPSLKSTRILNYEKHLGLLIALKCFVLVRVMLTSANVTASSAS